MFRHTLETNGIYDCNYKTSTSTSDFGDGRRISTHADPTRCQRAGRIVTRTGGTTRVQAPTLIAHAIFWLLGSFRGAKFPKC